MYSYPSAPRIPDIILERIRAKDRTLVDDLTFEETVEIYRELARPPYSGDSRDTLNFMEDVIIPEKTAGKLLTKREWESFRVYPMYNDYILGLLNYFSNKDDKEGMEAVRDLILKEGVKMRGFDAGYLRTSNPYVFKLMIDFNPKNIGELFFHRSVGENIPLLTDIFSYVKDKVPKKYVLEVLNDKIKSFDVEFWGKGKPIIAMLESGIIDFSDLYNIILKYNRPGNIAWVDKIIEAQI